ncbi:sensor histidine kinase [Actinomadura sp. 9N215]|uniref:sensor histidine kinase n=1 Tax=Actinomadura sp. 9N215 TaxID=3375150 RepID=UPI0037AD0311
MRRPGNGLARRFAGGLARRFADGRAGRPAGRLARWRAAGGPAWPARGLARRRRGLAAGLRRFRVRVFALIVLVALVATGATAWLTVRTTTAQITESVAVEERTADLIHATLVEYAALHGTWEGVDRVVMGLGERTGQRIRLSTLDGIVVADTDIMNERIARPTSSRPATILDARPQLTAEEVSLYLSDPSAPTNLPNPFGPPVRTSQELADLTATGLGKLIANRRGLLRLAACLTRGSVPITRRSLSDGHWTVVPSTIGAEVVFRDCEERSRSSEGELEGDQQALLECVRTPPPTADPSGSATGRARGLGRCAERVYAERLEPMAPVTLQLKLGFSDDRASRVTIEPQRALAAAGLVAALMIVSTVLLSRRMLSSIAAVSQASRLLGAGDLSGRVRVRGDDEIADLAVAFNRMADSLQRSEERQRRMINDIAHELRTPLANIRGYLEALHDGVLPPDRELFASLHEEAVLQQRLIDDLQELALAESGGLVLHRVRVDAAELLETLHTAHRAISETAGVALAVRVPDAEPPLPPVDADPDRLRQAIGNLVTNAVRATPPGGSVTLGAHRPDDRRKGGTIITVTDTGHGIAPDDLPNVFDRFWRADSARGRDTGGRGLGLAIAREIVLAHGGTLTAESTPGTGSTFAIWLPAAAPDSDPTPAAS